VQAISDVLGIHFDIHHALNSADPTLSITSIKHEALQLIASRSLSKLGNTNGNMAGTGTADNNSNRLLPAQNPASFLEICRLNGVRRVGVRGNHATLPSPCSPPGSTAFAMRPHPSRPPSVAARALPLYDICALSTIPNHTDHNALNSEACRCRTTQSTRHPRA
jgi:hypothetical protein